MKFLSQDGLAYLWTKIQAKLDALASRITTDETAIAGKVDKVEGKGLSTEDYTTAEKAKLAGVEAGANAYTLPAATSGALGGVKQGANVSIAADGTLSATDTKYGEATTGSAGLMSATDKVKLNGIAEGANNYSLPAASSTVLGGIRLGSGLEYNSATGQTDAVETQYTAGSYIQINTSGSPSGHVAKEIACTYPAITNGSNVSIDTNEHGDIVISATYSNATQNAAGLMSTADKTKLDGVATGANAYSLPTASTSTKGGVKVGDNLQIDNEVLSCPVDILINSASNHPVANSAVASEIGVVRDSIRILKPTLQITEHFGGDTDKNFLIIDYYGYAVIHIDRYGLDGQQQQYEGDSVNIMNLPTINGVQLRWARNYDVSVKGSDNHFYCLHCVQGNTSMNLKKGVGDSGSYYANFDFTYDGVFELTA